MQPDSDTPSTPEAEASAKQPPVALALVVGLGAWVCGSVAMWRAAWPFTIDDAFISARYAQQWVAGNGLVYNIGEHVEGFSNFTWVCLLAMLDSFGAPFELGVKALGLTCAVLTVLAMLLTLTRRLHVRDVRLAAAAGVWLAVDPGFAVWTLGGLETPLFAALLMWAVYLWLDNEAHGLLHELSLGLLLGALAWTRPEGPAFAVGFYVLTFFFSADPAVKRSRRVASTYAFVIVAVGFLARYAYYGDIWPNPYYVKLGGGTEQLLDGLHYWAAAVGRRGGPLLLAWVALPFIAAVESREAKRAHLTLVLVMLAYSAFIIRAGREPFPFHRFVIPLLPFAVVSGFAGAQALVRRRPSLRYPVIFGAFMCAAAMPLSARGHWRQVAEQIHITHDISLPFGAWLQQLHAEEGPDITLAVFWAGAMPYAAGPELRTIDMGGLCDRHIATRTLPWDERHGGHTKHDFLYVLAQGPTFVTDDALHTLDALAELGGDRGAAYTQQRDLFLDMYTRINDDVFILANVEAVARMERYMRDFPGDVSARPFYEDFLDQLARGRPLVNN